MAKQESEYVVTIKLRISAENKWEAVDRIRNVIKVWKDHCIEPDIWLFQWFLEVEKLPDIKKEVKNHIPISKQSKPSKWPKMLWTKNK